MGITAWAPARPCTEESMSVYETFLTPEEIAFLIGRKKRDLQVEALRKMGIPFWSTR